MEKDELIQLNELLKKASQERYVTDLCPGAIRSVSRAVTSYITYIKYQ